VKKLKGKAKQVWESKIKQKPSENKHISYSAISTYQKCPKAWQLLYRDKVVPFTQNTYLVFGTAMHETIQEWLRVLYEESVKAATDLDLNTLLYDNMIKAYKSSKAQNGHEHFSTSEQLNEFWTDGRHILEWLKKERTAYFSTKNMQLVGIETLLYQDLKPGVKFKGLIDLVFYYPNTDTWTIMDIKTSTRGWNDDAKKDIKLTAQVILYKEFFSRQFDIPKDKINLEYFVVKRRVPKDTEFASMRRRVQTFTPNDGPRKTKQVLDGLYKFLDEVLDESNEYLQGDFQCNSPIGKCNECDSLVKKLEQKVI
jgi:hypothetical protein